jgi:threonine dehydratase
MVLLAASKSSTLKVYKMNSISLSDISEAQVILKEVLVETPTVQMKSDRWEGILPDIKGGAIKMELFQQAGSFKARGAYLGIQQISEREKLKGVVAASGGNHALAVAWAAKKAGVSAKIAMPKATDEMRINGCHALGAEVILCRDIADAFSKMETCASDEGRTIMHPFEGRHMTLGSATCGAEFVTAHPEIDLFIIPVGGGGLISGMATAIKLIRPEAIVIGVEPYGADSMFQSLKAGTAVKLDEVNTIADSLGSPLAMPYSYEIVRRHVDQILRIEDDDMRRSMRTYQDILKITAEPACAAALAALVGPAKDLAVGKQVGLIACGSNISLDRYHAILGASG